MNQEIRDRLTRARIQMQKKQPFFAYLVLNLNMHEREDIPTIAVDNYNNLYYNPKWLKPLSDGQIEMLLCHEVLHIAFEHLIRNGTRNPLLFNCATDMSINDILVSNNFQMVDGGIIPSNHEIDFAGVHISDIDKKSAENIYDELYSKVKQTQKNIQAMNDSRLDEHITDDLKGKGQGTKEEQAQAKEIQDNIKKWKKLLVEAGTYAKTIGQLPNGVERHIGDLLNEKINWKQILYRYITNTLPFDYSYSKPSRMSQSAGFYMPHLRKENIEVAVSIDTSGSINQEELTEFMSEIVYLAKSFNNLKMKVIVCDCSIKEVLEVDNGNIEKLKNLKVRGGGGTSHKPIYQLIQDEYPTTKVLINFTDGFTDFPNNETTRTLWVISKGGVEDSQIPFGDIIRL